MAFKSIIHRSFRLFIYMVTCVHYSLSILLLKVTMVVFTSLLKVFLIFISKRVMSPVFRYFENLKKRFFFYVILHSITIIISSLFWRASCYWLYNFEYVLKSHWTVPTTISCNNNILNPTSNFIWKKQIVSFILFILINPFTNRQPLTGSFFVVDQPFT